MASDWSEISTDVLSYALHRLPTKELCRLRAVCKSWRSLTSDAAFIRLYANHHKEQLLVAKFRDDKTHVYVVDLSGNVVKRIISGADGGGLHVLRTSLSLACLSTKENTCSVFNPATGGILQVLPPVGNRVRTYCTFFALGFVASTGKYKLLRCLSTYNPRGFAMLGSPPLDVQVLTINGSGSSTNTDDARWRPRPSPPLSIDPSSSVVVDGVVYFLTSAVYDASDGGMPADRSILPLDLERWWRDLHDLSSSNRDVLFGDVVFDNLALYHANNAGVPADYILSFDLEREEWRRDLHGPSSTGNLTSGQMLRSQLTLAHLKGSLVLAHHPRSLSILDLWFLLDFESRLWVKQYSIQTHSVNSNLVPGCHLIPLLVLHDGRLVIHLAPTGPLLICDPGTNSFTTVDMRHELQSVAVYTGSLLSRQEAGDMV